MCRGLSRTYVHFPSPHCIHRTCAALSSASGEVLLVTSGTTLFPNSGMTIESNACDDWTSEARDAPTPMEKMRKPPMCRRLSRLEDLQQGVLRLVSAQLYRI